jgi:hypothetical protein
MSKLARYRKAVAATLGTAATVAATIPPDTSLWRTAQIILALATIAGVTAVRNAPAVAGQATHTPEAGYPPPPSSRIADERPQPPPRRPMG